jgi:LmbE family N-acetylglucosaminyl deacetylase
MLEEHMKYNLWILFAVSLTLAILNPLQASGKLPAGDKLRVMIIGAHPDDPEKGGGTAAKYVELGHQVQLVAVTNGDAGHQSMGGGALAKRRTKEAKAAGQAIGADYIVLDNHDGELIPSLENRRTLIRVIREFNPDLIFTHRTNDYHPDHRYTGILVQDAAYMVMVPNIVADTPPLKKNPVIMFLSDHFTEPSSFKPDIVVAIDDVIEKKIDMYHSHESQMYEWLPWIAGYLDEVPKNKDERRDWLAKRRVLPGGKQLADKYRDKLIELYGKDKGGKVQYAEAFQTSEYGGRLTEENKKILFPFFD